MISLAEIVDYIDQLKITYTTKGKNISVKNLAAIFPQAEQSLCYFVGDNVEKLNKVKDSIIICKPELNIIDYINDNNNTFILTDNPQLCFYHVSSLFDDEHKMTIDGRSEMHPNARIGTNATIEAFCMIEECEIGDNVIIESGVKVYKNTIIGNNVHIQSNSVIGASGVMWAWDENNLKVRCAQTGFVKIEDDVFIGSNVTLVKGAFQNLPTIVGKGTMIAHGTMIGHGAKIGQFNHFANNVSLAGSVTTGNNCFFGSGATVRPHIYLPHDTIIGAGAVVVKDFEGEGITLVGNPARQLPKPKKNPSGIPARY